MLPKWPHLSPCFLCCHGDSQLKIVLSQVEESMHSDTGKALLAGELRGRAHSFLEQAAPCGGVSDVQGPVAVFPIKQRKVGTGKCGTQNGQPHLLSMNLLYSELVLLKQLPLDPGGHLPASVSTPLLHYSCHRVRPCVAIWYLLID